MSGDWSMYPDVNDSNVLVTLFLFYVHAQMIVTSKAKTKTSTKEVMKANEAFKARSA